jgi:hypothetical protein
MIFRPSVADRAALLKSFQALGEQGKTNIRTARTDGLRKLPKGEGHAEVSASSSTAVKVSSSCAADDQPPLCFTDASRDRQGSQGGRDAAIEGEEGAVELDHMHFTKWTNSGSRKGVRLCLCWRVGRSTSEATASEPSRRQPCSSLGHCTSVRPRSCSDECRSITYRELSGLLSLYVGRELCGFGEARKCELANFGKSPPMVPSTQRRPIELIGSPATSALAFSSRR